MARPVLSIAEENDIREFARNRRRPIYVFLTKEGNTRSTIHPSMIENSEFIMFSERGHKYIGTLPVD